MRWTSINTHKAIIYDEVVSMTDKIDNVRLRSSNEASTTYPSKSDVFYKQLKKSPQRQNLKNYSKLHGMFFKKLNLNSLRFLGLQNKFECENRMAQRYHTKR